MMHPFHSNSTCRQTQENSRVSGVFTRETSAHCHPKIPVPIIESCSHRTRGRSQTD